MITADELKKQFVARYSHKADGVVRAPGRVNLIGEHTDYNDGFVLPIAIERFTMAAFAFRDDQTVNIASCQQAGNDASFSLAGPIVPGEPKWANYVKGVVARLIETGAPAKGIDILFWSNVPLGGGLSSSASLEVASALAILGGSSAGIDQFELARICQWAENNFAGAPCGIMDQAVSVMAHAGRALLLDCRDGSTRQVKFDDPNIVVLVVDTKVKHDISDGGYALRRDQCYSAAAKLGVSMLRDADDAMLAGKAGDLADKELMRARHVIGEISRTLAAVEAMEACDFGRFGELMYASHESLRGDYEVSCEELDAVVELARPLAGVYGARMTGGGFGGCAVVLVDADKAEAAEQAIGDAFAKRFGHACATFTTHAATGAGPVQ